MTSPVARADFTVPPCDFKVMHRIHFDFKGRSPQCVLQNAFMNDRRADNPVMSACRPEYDKMTARHADNPVMSACRPEYDKMTARHGDNPVMSACRPEYDKMTARHADMTGLSARLSFMARRMVKKCALSMILECCAL